MAIDPNAPYTVDEIRETIGYMRKRYDERQGGLDTAMARLSLPMSEFLLAEHDALTREVAALRAESERLMARCGRLQDEAAEALRRCERLEEQCAAAVNGMDALRADLAIVNADRTAIREDREALRSELVAVLRESVEQACTMDDGTLDSMAISTYADQLHRLEELGQVEIVKEYGRRVVARWRT